MLFGAALALSACSGDGLEYVTGSETADRLFAFSRQGPQGTTIALRDHATFAWDRVFYFPKGTRHGEMESVVGAPVLDDPDERYLEHGALLVFVDEGVPVRALSMMPTLFMSGKSRQGYPRETATLIARSKDPGPYLLSFVD